MTATASKSDVVVEIEYICDTHSIETQQELEQIMMAVVGSTNQHSKEQILIAVNMALKFYKDPIAFAKGAPEK